MAGKFLTSNPLLSLTNAPKAGLKLDEDLWVGLGGPDRAQKDEGADRWSFISVRGNKRGGVCVPAGQWALGEGGKSVTLPRAVQQGMVLW